MAQIQGYRRISGTHGKLWWDGELIAEIKSFEAKITPNREDVPIAGQMGVDSKIMNYKGEGTIKIDELWARDLKKLAVAFMKGKDPRCQLTAKLDDPDSFGAITVTLNNVWFNEVTLMNFEVGSGIVSKEIPFGFTDFEIVESPNA